MRVHNHTLCKIATVKPKTPNKGRPKSDENPENINRCLLCKHKDCKYDSIYLCIAADEFYRSIKNEIHS